MSALSERKESVIPICSRVKYGEEQKEVLQYFSLASWRLSVQCKPTPTQTPR